MSTAPMIVHGGWALQGFDPGGAPILHYDAGVLVDAGLVREISRVTDLRARHPSAELVGGAGFAVVPGFVNAHHHVGLTPFQLGSPDHPLELWFASRLALRDVDLRADTLFSAFEMVASGITTVQHLHSRAPGTTANILAAAGQVVSAYEEVGMRVSYSLALRDQNRLVYEDDRAFVASLPPELRPAMAAYFERFTVPLAQQVEIFEELVRRHGGARLSRVQVAPSNLHWLSDPALEVAADLSARHGLPMHMHLLETPYQKAYASRRTGGSALRHIERLGLLGPQMTIGHGVWMTEDDVALCAHSGTRICHNCSSNFRLKSGTAPLNRFLAHGIPVAIGIDEAGVNDDRDMLQEMRMVLRTHREPGIDSPSPKAAGVLRMATEHGAATTPWAGWIGRLDSGMAADLMLIDWRAVTFPHQSTDIDVVEVLVGRAKAGAVRSVMIDGRWVYRDGRFTQVDREAVLAGIEERLSRPLTGEEEVRRRLAREVLPHVRAFYTGYLDELGDDPHYRMSGRS